MKHYLNDFHGKFIQIFLITCKFCEEYIWVYKTGIQQKKKRIYLGLQQFLGCIK